MLEASYTDYTKNSSVKFTENVTYDRSGNILSLERYGRSGLTSFTVVVCFVLALFFSPLFLAIPSAATGAVLVVVGVMMMSPIKEIDWSDYSEAIPAFITATMMPLTYSIAHGILLGIIAYVVINACTKNIKKISVAMWVLFVLFVLRYIFM